MTQEQIRQMEINKLENIIEGFIVNEFDLTANIKVGHAKDLHCGRSDFDLMVRSAQENKEETSSYYNESTMKASIRACLLHNVRDLCEWLKYYRSSTLELDLKMDEAVGEGFKLNPEDKKFEKYKTDTIKLILNRDTENLYIGGFYVNTSYPDLANGEKTNEFYTVDWFLKNLNGEINKIDEIALYIRTNYPGLIVQKEKENGRELLKVMYRDVNKDYNMYIDIYGETRPFKMKELSKQGQIKNLGELKETNHSLFLAAVDIKNKVYEAKKEINRTEISGGGAGRQVGDQQTPKKKKFIIVDNRGDR